MPNGWPAPRWAQRRPERLCALLCGAAAAAGAGDNCAVFAAIAPGCGQCAAFARSAAAPASCARCAAEPAGGADCAACVAALPQQTVRESVELHPSESVCDSWPAGPTCTRQGDNVSSCGVLGASRGGGQLGWACCPEDNPDCIDTGANYGGYHSLGPADDALIAHSLSQITDLNGDYDSTGSFWVGDENCRLRCALYGLRHNIPVCCYVAVVKYGADIHVDPTDPSSATSYEVFDPGCFVKRPANGTAQIAVLNGYNQDLRRTVSCRRPLGFAYDGDAVVSEVDANGLAAGKLRSGQRIVSINGAPVATKVEADLAISDWTAATRLAPKRDPRYAPYRIPAGEEKFDDAIPGPLKLVVEYSPCADCVARLPHPYTALACANASFAPDPSCDSCAAELAASLSPECARCRDVGSACPQCYSDAFAVHDSAAPACPACQVSLQRYVPRPNPCLLLRTDVAVCAECAANGSMAAAAQPGSPCDLCLRTMESRVCSVCYNTMPTVSRSCAACLAYLPRNAGNMSECLGDIPVGRDCRACARSAADLSAYCKRCQETGAEDDCFQCWDNVPDMSPPCASCYQTMPNLFPGGACRGDNCIGRLGRQALWLGLALTALPGLLAYLFVLFPCFIPAGKMPGVLASCACFISAFSYLAMSQGYGYYTPTSGRQVFWLRYFESALTMPLAVAMLCSLANAGVNTYVYNIGLTCVVNLARLLGSMQDYEDRLYFWCFSVACFTAVAYQMIFVLPETPEAENNCFRSASLLTMLVWVGVAAVWMLAQGTGIIDCDMEVICYCALDALGKGIVGLYVAVSARVPRQLRLEVPDIDFGWLAGVYDLASEAHNGYPSWGKEEKRVWMDASGHWMIGYEADMDEDGGKGFVVSGVRSRSALPHHVGAWHGLNQVECDWVAVQLFVNDKVHLSGHMQHQAKIMKITAGSPIAVAGLMGGDRLVQVGGVKVTDRQCVNETAKQLMKVREKFRKGESVGLTVLRDGQEVVETLKPVDLAAGGLRSPPKSTQKGRGFTSPGDGVLRLPGR
eukprot:TRINITY_DN65595_c0_g1_i1.p1 TRINITY_DN65595_c0_g1~~TRINITY_DN65595_c0_g1_i1.p1  ORF type:complete len:1031 (+),score=249.75 TRINITY_DN65595_c0_g1_i1:90-3182(+)